MYLKQDFLAHDFAVLIAEINDHFKYLDGCIFNSLGKDEPLWFGKLIDCWINPFHEVVRLLKHFCIRHYITLMPCPAWTISGTNPNVRIQVVFLNPISCCQARSSHWHRTAHCRWGWRTEARPACSLDIKQITGLRTAVPNFILVFFITLFVPAEFHVISFAKQTSSMLRHVVQTHPIQIRKFV